MGNFGRSLQLFNLAKDMARVRAHPNGSNGDDRAFALENLTGRAEQQLLLFAQRDVHGMKLRLGPAPLVPLANPIHCKAAP